MGATQGEATSYHGWARRLAWNKLKSLHRVMTMLIEIFLKLEKSEGKQAQALVVQCIKCLHQVNLNNGQWEQGFFVQY